jgi:hypothetical protein
VEMAFYSLIETFSFPRLHWAIWDMCALLSFVILNVWMDLVLSFMDHL